MGALTVNVKCMWAWCLEIAGVMAGGGPPLLHVCESSYKQCRFILVKQTLKAFNATMLHPFVYGGHVCGLLSSGNPVCNPYPFLSAPTADSSFVLFLTGSFVECPWHCFERFWDL